MEQNIPQVIHMANVYTKGNQLVGLSDEVTLPTFAPQTETISGFGLLGEIDNPTPGHFGSMELEVPFRVLNSDLFGVMAQGAAVDLTLRASEQFGSNAGVIYKGIRVVVRGPLKEFNPGSVKQGSPMGASVKVEITYILIEFDGKTMVELDKINPKYYINGVDQLAASMALC